MTDVNTTAPAPGEGVVVNQTVFDTPETRELVESIPLVVEESKAGYKTTEFWVGVILSLLTVLDTIPLPEKFEGVVVGVIGVAYVLSRGIAKKGVAHIPAAPDTPAT